MECPLCGMWEKLPFVKKPTTPTTYKESEGCLALGFWLGRKWLDSELCEYHTNLIAEYVQLFLNGRRSEASTQPRATPFVFGTEPLRNENTNTSQPQMPGNIDLTPYTGGVSNAIPVAIPNTTQPVPNQQTDSKPPIDFVKMALEAAKAPPTLGKTTLTCPTCGLEMESGVVHTCE